MSSGGLIGVPAQETARYSAFSAALAETEFPPGDEWEVYFRYGWGVAENINACIDEMVRRDKEWFWTMGDDHAWSPGLLTRLLGWVEWAEQRVDIVVPLCLMRNPPYRPVIWQEIALPVVCSEGHPTVEWDGVTELLACGCVVMADMERYERVELADHPEGGLIEVAAAGGAGMLIHRSVIDALGSDWFMYRESSKVGEDIYFCEKARAAGFKIWCDLDSVLGHCATTVVWPVREADGWTFGFSMMGGFQVTLPPGFQALADECA